MIFLATVLALAASIAFLRRVLGIPSSWLALLLLFYSLALARVARPLFVLTMPRALLPLRRWETNGRVYRRLGVVAFGRLLRRTPLRALNRAVYLDRPGSDPARVRNEVEAAEASHFWVAVVFLIYMADAGLGGQWGVVVGFSLAQLLVNIYPIFHLRHLRARLDRLQHRITSTSSRQGVRDRRIVLWNREL